VLHEWLVHHRDIEADYWWFVNKRRIVQALLRRFAPKPGVLLEVGCGGGYLSAQLLQAGWQMLSADFSPAAAGFARRRGVQRSLAFDAQVPWPFCDGIADGFLMLDVLEHLRDDRHALRQAARVLRPGGFGIVAVPAYQFLFSAWDEYNGHYRRYTTTSLARAAQDAGFAVRWRSYWNAASLPPALLLRGRDRLTRRKVDGETLEFPPVPQWLNRALTTYGAAEASWLRYAPIPLGLSAIVVLQKPEEPAQ